MSNFSEWSKMMQAGSPDEAAKFMYYLSGVPVIGGMVTTYYNTKYYEDYLRNRGMSWSDVLYPGRLNSGGFGSALNFVSNNIEKLYR